MTVETNRTFASEFLSVAVGVVMETSSLTTKEGAKTSTNYEKNNIECVSHALILPFFAGALDICVKFTIINIRRNNEER